MKIDSTNSIRKDFWPSYSQIDQLNDRITDVENEVDLLNINVVSNDTSIRESISALQNSYNEQIITNNLIVNFINANYGVAGSMNIDNLNGNNVYLENLTVNRPVFDLALNTAHLENTTSLNGNFYNANLIDVNISGNIPDITVVNANIDNLNGNNVYLENLTINNGYADKLRVNVNKTPVTSSAVLGYDGNGEVIPVKATFEVGFPENADYLYTDEYGTAFAGSAATTVEDSTNLIQAGAIQVMYNDINTTLDEHNNLFNDMNNNFANVDNNFNDISNALDAIDNNFVNAMENIDNNFLNIENNFLNIDNNFNNVSDKLNNALTSDKLDLLKIQSSFIEFMKAPMSYFNSASPLNYQAATVARFEQVAAGTAVGSGKLNLASGMLKIGANTPGSIIGFNSNISGLFANCKNMYECPSYFGPVTNMVNAFYDCHNLSIPHIYLNCAYSTALTNAFYNCVGLTNSIIHIPSIIPLESHASVYNALINNQTGINWTGRIVNDIDVSDTTYYVKVNGTLYEGESFKSYFALSSILTSYSGSTSAAYLLDESTGLYTFQGTKGIVFEDPDWIGVRVFVNVNTSIHDPDLINSIAYDPSTRTIKIELY